MVLLQYHSITLYNSHSIIPLMRDSVGVLMQRTPASLDYTLPNALQKVTCVVTIRQNIKFYRDCAAIAVYIHVVGSSLT